ncbi:LamG-like jellyroll fold domain-containing protein [Acidobacterium sp. S8]|uniref:glycosyl hydrolase 2 galactose-binding domain-containing protein n=1 Tax=Acidobacterium sp. S8 TaxID=1641854 RepID=UPI00131D9B38|nr:LamG-like jellyroll fold domain-containing protein [Acidobacterium sp. S8]
MNRSLLRLFCLLVSACIGLQLASAQIVPTNDPPEYGPYNGVFLPDGEGLRKPLLKTDTVLRADAPWSLSCWVRTDAALDAPSVVAGLGDPTEEYPRFLALSSNKLILWLGKDNSLEATVTLAPATWHLLAATFDGSTFHLYSDGREVTSGALVLGSVSPVISLAPGEIPAEGWKHFGGKIESLTLTRHAMSAEEIKQLYAQKPDFSLAAFEEGSKPWPIQTRGQAGYRAPQDPETLPHSKAPFQQPVAKPLPASHTSLEADGENHWTIAGGWKLIAAPETKAAATDISQTGFDSKSWLAATVPGTVLTTMIDRGVYPDPDYGLNNLAIPESLNKQDYWYRTEFKGPRLAAGQHLSLTFEGINYKASVWLNSQSLGNVTGAFIRGTFDVTKVLKLEQTNVLAVRISPPPHPGIPQEQSVKGGPGENGGMMCLDGPTFVATEGWDWIPAVRDRNTGIWQPVTLTATAAVNIGDPQVVTTLPLPDISRASVEINVPVENQATAAVHGTLTAAFEGVNVTKEVTIQPGTDTIKLSPSEFAQLTVQNPRLWWPNGYGKPELYHLKLTFNENGTVSDIKQLRFGIREITYELSLLDSSGHLRRVEYAPSEARSKDQPVVDISHEGMRGIPAADPPPPNLPEAWRENWRSWVASLKLGAETSPAIHIISDTSTAPYLVIKVNGVKIACRGGNWGMDDSRKRVSRQRLEPYFRLHRDANLNIIRNWVGQDTEQTFFDLADEYGMLVWNDFWESTQNYNVEAQDPELFLNNARDTILRFRNHPSIVMWCGRNEGVPQPIINEGLADLTRTLDGTRYYSPSSNQVNLQNSGPYHYMDPSLYFTTLNHGFSVETGTPSMSTLESFKQWVPKQDQWPVDDVWAYHDWHQSGNGDVATFIDEIQSEFGAPTGLEDFERKSQMLNYVDHRAIFEGMNAHLWAPNSGRLLWMTQPAWPSNMWQILSSDYDTQASFYGTKKACEPVHVQLNLPDYGISIVNTTTTALAAVSVSADVYSLDNKLLLHRDDKKDVAADSEMNSLHLDLSPLLAQGVALVKLELRDSTGKELSSNFYWLGAKSASYRQLNHLPPATLSVSASQDRDNGTVHVHVQLQNHGNAVALANKLTLLNADDGSRILPAYYSDNYVSLLPGESREIDVEYPSAATDGKPEIAIRGWNLPQQMIPIAGK